jgi:1-acyl-sn-glycerol-3-phosphate acyltransferase
MTVEALPDPLSRNVVWRTIQFALQNVFCFWLGYRARGLERLPAQGGALLLINHQSYLDPLLVGLALRRPVSYLARDSLFRVPVIGWILRRTYVMPINREAASTSSLREAIRRLQHGFYVGIFPEGTRTTTGGVGELKPGFLALLRRANVPVHPVGIAGAFEAFPRGSWFLRPARVCVVFGEALTADELAAIVNRGQVEALEEIRRRIVACQQSAEAWRSEAAAESCRRGESAP